MSAPSRLKRARLGRKSRAPDRDIIDLTSDTESSPPSKRLKSDSPLFPNGFVKSTTKSTSSFSSGSGASTRSVTPSRHDHTLSVNNGFSGSTSSPHSSRNSVPVLVLPERSSISNPSGSSPRSRPHLPSQLPQNSDLPSRQKSGSHTSQTPGSLPASSRRLSNEFDVPSGRDQTRVAEREARVDHTNASLLSTQSNSSPRSKPPSRSSTRRQELLASNRSQGPSSNISHRPAPVSTLPQHTPKPEQTVGQSKSRSQFELIIPLSKDRLPFHLREEWREKREAVLEDARTERTAPAGARLKDLQKYVGPTGFSDIYNTESIDISRRTKAAPKLVREINRKDVDLDWSVPSDDSDNEDTDNFDMSALVHPAEQVKQVLTRQFAELQDPPLVFANDVNDKRLNGKFQFVSEYIFRPGVRRTEERSNTGCLCDGVCSPHPCGCLPRAEDHSGIERAIQTYEINSTTGVTVLTEEYMLNEMEPSGNHFEISECNKICGCYPDCWNHVVSRGRTVPLEIFQTAKCGFGVRSSVDIVRGQFIELYLGEVITQQELERREDAEEDNEPSYIYSLDWFTSKGCYHVDGKNFGSAMRFVNHSCDPNARNFTVIKNKVDKNVYYLAFFAIKDIEAGEEICIDYSPQNAGVVEDEGSKDGTEPISVSEHPDDDGRAKCYCDAENCRKWLWTAAGRKRRGKKRKTTKHGYDKE